MALPSTNLSKSEICVPSYTLSCLILYAHCLSFFCSSVPPSLPSVLPLSFPPSLYSHNKNFKIYWVSTECQSLYKLCCLVTAAVNSLQSCLTLCNPIDGSPPGSPRPQDSPGKNTGVGCHFLLQCMKVKSESEVAQSCPTISDPMDCSLPGSSVHRIFQARVLEWGAIAFSGLVTKSS